ncbi:MAG: 30S ribosome-binding factor RbfA [bacterium]|nr:30S ribosome-binding factor RbfA [bacterium]
MKSLKSKKIGSLITREISSIILEDIKDPHIKFVSITDADVSNDLSFAKVYFTCLNREYKEETEKALNHAANYIELELSKRIEIRKMPQISFHYDNSIEYGEQIEKKIKEINEK